MQAELGMFALIQYNKISRRLFLNRPKTFIVTLGAHGKINAAVIGV